MFKITQSSSAFQRHLIRIYTQLFKPKFPRLVIGLVILLSLLSLIVIPRQTKIYFEDGRMDNLGLAGDDFYGKVTDLFGGNLQPTVLINRGGMEDERTLRAFNNRLAQDQKGELPYRNIVGLSSFIPKKQEEKKVILARLINKFQHSNFPPPAKKEELVHDLSRSTQATQVEVNSLPKEVTRMFQSLIAPEVYAIYLVPNFKELTWQWMEAYTDAVRTVRQEADLNFLVADNPFLATDFVRLVQKESPKIMGVVFLGLLIIVCVLLRPLPLAISIFLHLLIGLILTLGALWLFKIKLNTLNVIAFPIILGTGIDCFIHFGLRFHETHQVTHTIQHKLPSVIVSNLTTMIGFGGLIFTPSFGLRSLGYTTMLGLAIMTLLCTFLLPRVLTLPLMAKHS